LELAKKQFASGKSVLILTPEISLTPQLVKEFEAVFGSQTLVLHSNLTEAERRESWLNILNAKDSVVVIGPRSALFAPFKDLGLVVIDESHEGAYKQEQAPHYQATRVAAKLAELHKAQFVMGSATPSVSDYFIAQAKNMPILRMNSPAVKSASHQVKTSVIAANNKTQFNRNHYLSDKLLKAIEARLSRGEQSLMFLNRRGTARLVLCQNCSWQALCPNCDLPLTYHGDGFVMRCHTCGYKASAPTKCPVCASTDIIYKSMGTKAVVEALQKLFPNARIQRFDSDSKKAERLEQHYKAIKAGDIDILVGTQILVKGLDLPKLSLVGVISADHSLSFPDYTAEERAFQQLSQILGRVGRGHIEGEAIIQTFRPDSLAIGAAIGKSWDIFYESQIKERQKFMFPPFCYLLKLTCTRKSINSARSAAVKLHQDLNKLPLKMQVIGPTPSFYEKSAKGFTWQLVIKSKNRSELLEVIKNLPSGWSFDIDPEDLL
jgi:primosomal protein N' (replication factor Y) (superfamily II helicase)